MAFATKYDFEFTSIDGDTINIAIQQDNFGGSKRTVDIADVSPIIITWQGSATEKENPILGSSASIRFIASSNFEFQEFFYAKDQEYKVIVQKNGTNYWLGWVVAGQYNEPLEKDMYSIELLCTDGLGDLDNIPLRDSSKNPLTGQYTFGAIIQECLTTNNPLGLSVVDNSEFFVDLYSITTANNYRYRVTLTGTSGTANIAIKGTNYLATFSSDLNTTASNFESTHSVNIGTNEAVGVNAVTNDIDFVSPFDFTCTITNATGDLDGTVSKEFDSALGNITVRVDGLSDDGNIPDPDGKELWTCGEALRQILKLSGCRLLQSEGKWVIQDVLRDDNYWQKQHDTTIAARADGQEFINPVRYNKYVGTGNIYPINAGGSLSVIPGYEKISFVYDSGYKENFLSGGFTDDDFSSDTELNDWVRSSGSHYSIFSSVWNTTTLTINKTEEVEEISCEINGINTEAHTITSFSDNGAGQLRVNNSGTNPFAVNDVVFIDYGPTGEDGNYYGYHTVTAVASGYYDVSAVSFTTDDYEGGCVTYHYHNSTYLEQFVNAQDTTNEKQFDDEDGQELEIKIRYKVQNPTDSQRDDYEYHIPVMVAVDATSNHYIDFNKEWTTDSNSFYRIIGNEINTYQEETIKISLDNLSTVAGDFYIAVGQLVTLPASLGGYANATGYLISDISAKIGPAELATLTEDKTINGNFSDLAPPKEVEFKFGGNPGILSFPNTYTQNSAFISERHMYAADESDITTSNGFANQDKQAGEDLDEWHEYRYKKMYRANSMVNNFEFKESDRAITLEPYHFLQDSQVLGRRFLITSLSKDLKENIGSLEAIEIKPREDIFDCISGTVTANNHVNYEPNHFIGSNTEIKEFVNIVEPFNVTAEQVARLSANTGKALSFDTNNIPYIDNDVPGEEPYLTSSTAFQFTQPYTLILVVNVTDTVAGDRYIHNSADGTTTTGAVIINNDDLWIDAGTKVDTGLTLTTDRVQVITVEFNGASSEAWINSTSSGTLSAGTDQCNGASIMGDNPTSGNDSLPHNWYGTYIYSGSLSDDDREALVDKLRSRTLADKISITPSVKDSTPNQLDIAFGESVTGFTTEGLSLYYKNAAVAERTITADSQSGSGTTWTIDLSDDLNKNDILYLDIKDLNPATATPDKYLYPGRYPVVNNLSGLSLFETSLLGRWDSTQTSGSQMTDLSAGTSTQTPRNLYCFNANTAGNDAYFPHGTGSSTSIDFDWADSFTVCFWMKSNETGSFERILSNRVWSGNFQGIDISHNASGQIKIEMWGDNSPAYKIEKTIGTGDPIRSGAAAKNTADVADGDWHFVAITYSGNATPDENNIEIYVDSVDGDLIKSTNAGSETGTFGSQVLASGSDWYVANRSGGSNDQDISLQHVQFFSSVKSHQELIEIQHRKQDKVNKIRHYGMEEESGATLYNSHIIDTGNRRHGTITGSSAWGRVNDGVYSCNNRYGYTLSGSVLIPRDQNATDLDAAGTTIAAAYLGKSPYHGTITGSSPLKWKPNPNGLDEMNNAGITSSTEYTVGTSTNFEWSELDNRLFRNEGDTEWLAFDHDLRHLSEYNETLSEYGGVMDYIGKTTYLIAMVASQSNMSGEGDSGSIVDTSYNDPVPGAYIANNTGSSTSQSVTEFNVYDHGDNDLGNTHGPDFSMLKDIVDAGSEIYCYKYSIGSTGFRNLILNYHYHEALSGASGTHLYPYMTAGLDDALQLLRDAGYINIEIMLFTDFCPESSRSRDRTSYAADMTAYVNNFASEYSEFDGKVVVRRGHAAYHDLVPSGEAREAVDDFVLTSGDYRTYNTDSYSTQDTDDVHFDRPGQESNGQDAAYEFISLMGL